MDMLVIQSYLNEMVLNHHACGGERTMNKKLSLYRVAEGSQGEFIGWP